VDSAKNEIIEKLAIRPKTPNNSSLPKMPQTAKKAKKIQRCQV